MSWAIPTNRECDPNSDSQRPIVVELCEQMIDVLVGGVALPKIEKKSISWSSRSEKACNHQSVASVLVRFGNWTDEKRTGQSVE